MSPTTRLRVTVEAAWNAVRTKDRSYDGRFVYAATTTGIYCRPSCPARNPERQNTIIFQNAQDAESEGYDACLRCYPNALAPAEKGVQAALDYIDEHLDETVSLKSLSRVSGLSPHHLQQTFKRIVGLSPKSICDTRRIFLFKMLLRRGHSISEASYQVGYGSSRALYEKVGKRLGMTPGEYQRGGVGISIRYSIVDSIYGSVLIAATDRGICEVLLGRPDALLVRELREKLPNAIFHQESPRVWKIAVVRCEGEDPFFSTLPVGQRERIFQAKVLQCLHDLELNE